MPWYVLYIHYPNRKEILCAMEAKSRRAVQNSGRFLGLVKRYGKDRVSFKAVSSLRGEEKKEFLEFEKKFPFLGRRKRYFRLKQYKVDIDGRQVEYMPAELEVSYEPKEGFKPFEEANEEEERYLWRWSYLDKEAQKKCMR